MSCVKCTELVLSSRDYCEAYPSAQQTALHVAVHSGSKPHVVLRSILHHVLKSIFLEMVTCFGLQFPRTQAYGEELSLVSPLLTWVRIFLRHKSCLVVRITLCGDGGGASLIQMRILGLFFCSPPEGTLES